MTKVFELPAKLVAMVLFVAVLSIISGIGLVRAVVYLQQPTQSIIVSITPVELDEPMLHTCGDGICGSTERDFCRWDCDEQVEMDENDDEILEIEVGEPEFH